MRKATAEGSRPAVDLDQEGTALVAAPLTAANAAPAEAVRASVLLSTATSWHHSVYIGPSTGAVVAPDAALAATDVQEASVSAEDGARFRSLIRPFRAGGDPVFTLPPPLGGARFTVEDGRLVASWTALPPLDLLEIAAVSVTEDPMSTTFHFLEVSARFVTATGLTQIALDTDLPGFKPEWKLDFDGAYLRDMIARRIFNGENAASVMLEFISPMVPLTAPDAGDARSLHAARMALRREALRRAR